MSGRLMLLCRAVKKRIAAGEDFEAVLACYLLDDAEIAQLRAEVEHG